MSNDVTGNEKGARPGRRRKLTPFLAQEMLFEYATDQLDPERRVAIDEFLKTDRETRETLARIEKALGYCKSLSETEPVDAVLERLRAAENATTLRRRYSSLKEWPDVMRWALLCLLLLVCTAAIVSAVPWKRLGLLRGQKAGDSIEIAALPTTTQVFSNTEPNEADSTTPETSGDEEMEDGVDDASVAAISPSPKTVTPVPSPSSVTSAPKVVATPVPVAASTPIAPPITTGKAKAEHVAGNAFVYRAFMTLPNLEERADKITDGIIKLGGTKAGEVELGWKRGTGRYYHFAIPETNEAKLLEELRAYGPVRISKDAHPRVMPAGQIRFILWVESGI